MRDPTTDIEGLVKGDVQQGCICPYGGIVWSSNGGVEEIQAGVGVLGGA